MKKILVISSQIVGGCFIYADKIISNLRSNVEIAMPETVYEIRNAKPDWTFKYSGCSTLGRMFSHDGKMHIGEENRAFARQSIKMMKLCTSIIFLSEYVRNLVVSNFGIDKPYIIAPHGLIDYGQIRTINYSRQNDKPVLLFLGRISRYKGIELLLEALEYVDKSLYKGVVVAGK